MGVVIAGVGVSERGETPSGGESFGILATPGLVEGIRVVGEVKLGLKTNFRLD